MHGQEAQNSKGTNTMRWFKLVNLQRVSILLPQQENNIKITVTLFIEKQINA